jgi:hypothetical protein
VRREKGAGVTLIRTLALSMPANKTESGWELVPPHTLHPRLKFGGGVGGDQSPRDSSTIIRPPPLTRLINSLLDALANFKGNLFRIRRPGVQNRPEPRVLGFGGIESGEDAQG